MAKKRLQKWLAFCLAVSMLMGTTAMAVDAETTTGEVIVESKPGGGEESINVNVNITPKDDGGKIKEAETPEGGAKTESGLTVHFESTENKDAEGNVTDGESAYTVNNSDNTYGAEGGSETETKQVSPSATLDVPLTAGETNSVTDNLQGGTAPTHEGDALKSENPAIYDQTTTTVVKQGSVSVTNNGVTVTTGSGLGGEYDSDEAVDWNPVNSEWTGEENNVKAPEQKLSDEKIAEAMQNKSEGYDFLYVGSGESSLFGADWTFPKDHPEYGYYGTTVGQFQMADGSTVNVQNKTDADGNPIQATDKDGNPLVDENGDPVYEKEYTFDVVTAYCTDLDTTSKTGYWYSVENLDDAGYFKVNGAEEHIRAIVLNGYWGTEGNQKDADGNDVLDKDGNPVPETGSLAAVKAMMAEAKDKDGNPVFTQDDINALTEGEALTATQMSVWKYGNPYQEGIELESSTLYKKVHGDWIYNSPDLKNADGEAMDGDDRTAAKERINKLYEYLTSLTAEAEETEVIGEEKFIDELSMTVGEKTKENADGNGNDAYNVDLTFSLVVTPSQENDDLIVKVINSAGEVVSTARIAGDGANDVGFSTLETITDANGKTSYTMTGLELIEGSNTKFNLKLEGAQYLEQGVYVYTSEVRDEVSSQTFVGIAEGYKSVDVSMEVDLSFDVEESVIKTERVWRTEWTDSGEDTGDDDIITGDDDDDDDDDDDTVIGDDDVPQGEFPGDDDNDLDEIPEEDTPKAELPAEDVPLEELPEEDVPLADVPKTGDASILWFALSALSGAGLMGLNIGRKREDEE